MRSVCLVGELLTSAKEKYSFNPEHRPRFNQLDLNNSEINQIKKEYIITSRMENQYSLKVYNFPSVERLILKVPRFHQDMTFHNYKTNLHCDLNSFSLIQDTAGSPAIFTFLYIGIDGTYRNVYAIKCHTEVYTQQLLSKITV